MGIASVALLVKTVLRGWFIRLIQGFTNDWVSDVCGAFKPFRLLHGGFMGVMAAAFPDPTSLDEERFLPRLGLRTVAPDVVFMFSLRCLQRWHGTIMLEWLMRRGEGRQGEWREWLYCSRAVNDMTDHRSARLVSLTWTFRFEHQCQTNGTIFCTEGFLSTGP